MSNSNTLFPQLNKIVSLFDFENIKADRKIVLQPLIDFIQLKVNNNLEIRLNFICTHNSRRSHLSQVWAQTAAYYFNIKNVFCYSGGTEATALFPKIAETLKLAGFTIKMLSEGENPIYAIKFTAKESPIVGFSKKYDDAFNPESNFASIMTCSQADDGCPIITGSEKRFSINYEDPKVFDNTPFQDPKYQERSFQIANEMFFIFSRIKI